MTCPNCKESPIDCQCDGIERMNRLMPKAIPPGPTIEEWQRQRNERDKNHVQILDKLNEILELLKPVERKYEPPRKL
jgi:hypothetical protein